MPRVTALAIAEPGLRATRVSAIAATVPSAAGVALTANKVAYLVLGEGPIDTTFRDFVRLNNGDYCHGQSFSCGSSPLKSLPVRGAKPADCNALLSSLEPSAIRAILASVGLATAPPERKPAVTQTGDEI